MRVLAIAPHADDETLGCGARLLQHQAAGDSICWLIATRGHSPRWSEELLASKDREIDKVAEAYGFEKVYRLGYPAIRMDTVPLEELIGAIGEAIAEAKPDYVYVNHFGDVHSDHLRVFEATMAVLKPFYSSKHGVRRVMSYEVPSSTDAMPPIPARNFLPNMFSDVTDFIDRKLELMSMYETEVQPYPLPRSSESIRALARYRGATIGAEYAEAFMLIREIA
jgi:LmbE family N-acetylglucosaminyl deacetylase